jgi:hypothetical protein
MHPSRHRNPLRREGLQLVDGMERGIVEEAADELEALVVRNMRSRLLRKRSAIEVVREVRLDNHWRYGRAHRKCVDRHRVVKVQGVAELSEVAETPEYLSRRKV